MSYFERVHCMEASLSLDFWPNELNKELAVGHVVQAIIA